MASAFLSPAQIRSKALLLYPKAISAWLRADKAFFPHRLKVNLKIPPSATQPDLIQWAEALKRSSKESLGHGFSLTRSQINSRKFGDNLYPTAVSFDSLEDLLKLTGKTPEFRRLRSMVELLRARLPQLEDWLQSGSNWKKLLDLADDLPPLVKVVETLRDAPRPGCYVRELPIAVSTKLVAKRKLLLRSWLDQVLDSADIDSGGDKDDFESRYGFRSPQKHVLLRLLDPDLASELGLPCQELSLPATAISQLPAHNFIMFVVENKISLINALCLPVIPRGIAIGGLGNNLSEFRKIHWLAKQRIIYWGDLDVEGLQILSRFRWHFPNTRSLLMDARSLATHRKLCTLGNGKPPSGSTEHLTAGEQAAMEICLAENLRLEQEHIPFPAVLSAVEEALAAPTEEL